MGVNTLLKQLAPCLEDSHVERFRGKTVAVDGNTFIFRGCYSCSEQVREKAQRNMFLRTAVNAKFEIQILPSLHAHPRVLFARNTAGRYGCNWRGGMAVKVMAVWDLRLSAFLDVKLSLCLLCFLPPAASCAYHLGYKVALALPCSGPVDHLLKRVHMLKHYGVKPWVVLDGRRTPMKVRREL